MLPPVDNLMLPAQSPFLIFIFKEKKSVTADKTWRAVIPWSDLIVCYYSFMLLPLCFVICSRAT